MSNEAYFMDAGEEFLAHYGVKGMKWGRRKARPEGGGSAIGRVARGAVRGTINYHRAANRAYANGAKAVGRGVVNGAKAVGRGAQKLNRPLNDKQAARARKVGAGLAVGGLALAGVSAAAARNPKALKSVGGGAKKAIRGAQNAQKVANGLYRIGAREQARRKAYKTAARAAVSAAARTHSRTYRNVATVIR